MAATSLLPTPSILTGPQLKVMNIGWRQHNLTIGFGNSRFDRKCFTLGRFGQVWCWSMKLGFDELERTCLSQLGERAKAKPSSLSLPLHILWRELSSERWHKVCNSQKSVLKRAYQDKKPRLRRHHSFSVIIAMIVTTIIIALTITITILIILLLIIIIIQTWGSSWKTLPRRSPGGKLTDLYPL